MLLTLDSFWALFDTMMPTKENPKVMSGVIESTTSASLHANESLLLIATTKH